MTTQPSDEATAAAHPSASTVVAAFAAAGLPAPNPRNNTSSNCADLKCSELITTDAISVYVFDSEAPAVSFAAVYGAEAHRDGTVVLSYAAAHTPVADRAKYEKVLAGLS